MWCTRWTWCTYYRRAYAISFVKADNALNVKAVIGSLRGRSQLQLSPDLSVFAVGIYHDSL